MTQNEKLVKRFDNDNAVTPRYAKNVFRIANLSARISELRDAGYKIQTVRNRRGTKYVIA